MDVRRVVEYIGLKRADRRRWRLVSRARGDRKFRKVVRVQATNAVSILTSTGSLPDDHFSQHLIDMPASRVS